MTKPLASSCFAWLAALSIVGCAPSDFNPELGMTDAQEPVDDGGAELSSQTVADAARSSCSTASVKGLALQIIDEANCLSPGAFAALPSRPNLVAASHVFLFLEQPARDRLVQALDAHPSSTFVVNSMLRTLPQQYLLYDWSQDGACGIGLAAYPGASNHETGLALDIDDPYGWRGALEARGFRWFGSADEVHFDYVGTGATDHRGLDVRAFQRLWNRNHPSDRIAEDGDFGPSTESRLRTSPAGGFPVGAQCSKKSEPVCTAMYDDICSSPYRADIEWLGANGLASGCDADSFCPDRVVSRGELIAMIALGLRLDTGAPDAFVDDDGSPFEWAINAAKKKGFVSGCASSPPRFCPSAQVNRETLAQFLFASLALPAGPDAFNDDEASPFEPAINALANAGISSGCAAGKFCPTRAVTRGEAAYFLRRAFELFGP